MRRWLIILAVSSLLVAACTAGPDPDASPGETPPTSAATPTSATEPATSTTTTTSPPPNEVVMGEDQEPPTLNPYAEGGDAAATSMIAQAIHAGLTEVDGETWEIVPVLAVEVPSVSNGGVTVADDGTTTVVYRIRDEATWADGVPIAGDDVVFTYEVIMAIEDRPSLTDEYAAITGIEADGKRVTLTFAAPTLAFETMFPTVIPAHQVRGSDVMADWNEEPWAAAGPFVFESWTPGEAITLRRNDAYWKVGPDSERLPHLDRVVVRFIPETERLIEALVAGEVDVARPPPVRDVVDRLRSVPGLEVTVRESAVWEHLTFQFGRNDRNPDSLNRYLDFRRAVAYAIDRQAVLDLGFWEGPRPLETVLDLHGPDTEGPWERYRHDPAAARDLVDGLCERLGRDCVADPPVVVLSTTSNAEERPAIAELLVDQLGDAGIEVRLELEDSTLFFGRTLVNGTWDLGMWAWLALPGPTGALGILGLYDPDEPVAGDPNQGTPTGNYARWGTGAVSGVPTAAFPFDEEQVIDVNQEASLVRDDHTARYAEILDEMASTADRRRFEALAAEAEGILADQVVLIPLIARTTVGAVRGDRIDGYVLSGWDDTWNIETWRRIG